MHFMWFLENSTEPFSRTCLKLFRYFWNKLSQLHGQNRRHTAQIFWFWKLVSEVLGSHLSNFWTFLARIRRKQHAKIRRVLCKFFRRIPTLNSFWPNTIFLVKRQQKLRLKILHRLVWNKIFRKWFVCACTKGIGYKSFICVKRKGLIKTYYWSWCWHKCSISFIIFKTINSC